MNEFGHIAERIAGCLREASLGGGIRASDIADIVGDAGEGDPINCYPGVPSNVCHKVAVFVSLASKVHKGGHRGHLTFRQAIKKLVRHMLGYCEGGTQAALLIVDTWDGDAASEWTSHLRTVQNDAYLEVYLVGSGTFSPISV